MRLTRIEGTVGDVSSDGLTQKISLLLIDDPRVGDYLIVHAGYAINRIDEEAALETLELLNRFYRLKP
jgi:hydrogenase expression/formation protein HypC